MSPNNTPDGVVYHVNIPKDKKRVNVICIGIECLDNTLDNCYMGINELPRWIQGRIAILMLCDPNPPPTEVKGIGKRLSEETFWIYG